MAFFFLSSFLCFGQTFSGSTGAIDDDNCPTTNDFTTSVSGVGVLGTTNFFNEVVVNITHTYTGDLEMTLVAPGGSPSVLLSSNNGGSGNNYTDTHFRLDAIFSIAAGTAPFTGDFRSEESFALLDGINADGNWTLEICDEFGSDVGTLDSWEITFGTEPVEPFICTNPINPSPSCNNFNVVVVLDESGSIDEVTEAQVEAASFALANALLDTGASLAFVEFAETGDIPTYGGFSGWNEVDQAYIDGLNNQSTGIVAQYGENDNTTGPLTNWEDALNKVLELNVVQVADIVLFMTDGNPTADSSGGTGTSLGNALDESCEVKQMGSHIFMLGVGTGIEANNLAEISGPIVDDGPANPTLTVLSADYGLISAGDITQCFLDIAQSGCNNNLTLEKSVYAGHDGGVGCSGEETISNPNDSKVTYCFTVSNGGDQVINNLEFSDSDIGIDESNLTPAFQTSIASGQSVTYYYEMTFSNGQTFPFLNTAEVTGETPTGDPLSDSSSAEVTESLCTFPSLTTNDISVCSVSKTTIDLSTLITSNGTVSYHNSQLDADNNDNALTNINVSPSFDAVYYVRSQTTIDCYVTDIITINVTQVPELPILECWQTAMINEQTCQWEISGEQPVEPTTACYEIATFNPQTCQWEVTGEQPLEPETACYEVATFNDKICQWEVTGEQPLEPETACYEIATFNPQKCQWIITGEQPLEPNTACYEVATFNDKICQWEVTGEQPLEPETACYEIATFNPQKCQWIITGEQPIEPETACYEIATFNDKICQWEVAGEQPIEPEIACYEIATFNPQKCQWDVTGEQPLEPETVCYKTAIFNTQTCHWEISGEQPLEPETACYESARFNYQICEWVISGEQPLEPETACYE
ncbi:proprotein convertase P-domain-containing protein, partial [Psychroserpens sp.]|uniref:proprotein convertase P-domain-containing protein n=1 Tax=Psychroserpens sp. TaxID=2020870 RepID=UPI00385A5B83